MKGSMGRLRQTGVPALCLGLFFAFACPAIGMADAQPGNAPAPASPAPTPKPAPNPGANDNSGAPNDAGAQAVDVASKPAAVLSGKAKWTDGFSVITDSLAQIRAAVEKAGLKPADHPITVFTETTDDGFSYQAMLPLADKPASTADLSDTVKLGSTPAGRAIKFQHRGPYDDIDSTYDLITAYLDEKGLEAQDIFEEEYLSELKAADDPNLAVDIYVFLK
jgi:effector-binding domain-containing protein